MTVRTDFLQVGVSNTATQNFTLKTNNDGTAKLARGNFDATTQDVINVNASGVVDFPQGATIGGSAGQKMLLTASQATTSGTSIDFTGIPSWAKKITVMFNGVSTNGTSLPLIQLGTSSGFEVTGYIGNAGVVSGTTGLTSSGAGIPSAFSSATSNRLSTFTFVLHSGFTWMVAGLETADTLSTSLVMISGRKTLVGTLDRIRLTTVNGTDTFDAGSVSLLIEGY